MGTCISPELIILTYFSTLRRRQRQN